MSKLTIKTALATAVCGLLISAPAAYANHDDDERGYWANARVVDVDPIYREVRVRETREVCEDVPVVERTHVRGGPDPGAMLVGAVIGGVIGHQFGGGSGKDVATAAGAFIGANHAANNSHRSGRTIEREVVETRCETVRPVRYEREIRGYDVAYRYQGRIYHTTTREHPGKFIRVRVDVSPARWD